MFGARLSASALVIGLISVSSATTAVVEDRSDSCPPKAESIEASDASRLSRDCSLTGVVVEAGELSVVVPEPGTGVGAYALDSAGTEASLEVESSSSGVLTVVVAGDDHSEDAAALQDAAPIEAAASATSARCSVTARSESGHRWIPGSAGFYVNDNERLPSNIAVGTWRNIINASQGVWENATNNCGLSMNPNLSLSTHIDTSRDAGISSSNG